MSSDVKVGIFRPLEHTTHSAFWKCLSLIPWGKKNLVIKEYYSTVICLLSSGISLFSPLCGTIADIILNDAANLNEIFRSK